MTNVPVKFVSEWDEGDVVSDAKLNLTTGEVFDIETSDTGESYESLIREYVEIPGCDTTVTVIPGDADNYRAESMDRLEKLKCELAEMRAHYQKLNSTPSSGM